MAKIPQYTRSVTPQNIPYAYARVDVTPEAFGTGVSKALNETGNAISGMAKPIMEFADKMETARIIELYSDQTWENENLYDKDNGYYYKTGKDAMGKTSELMDSYDKYMDERLTKAGFRGQYRVKAEEIYRQRRNTIYRNINAHDRKETDNYIDNVYKDAAESNISSAVRLRNNDNDVDMKFKDGMTLLDNYALNRNIDSDTINPLKKQYAEKFTTSMIDSYLADNNLKALEYFDKNKDKLSAENQNKYSNITNNMKTAYTARTTAQALFASGDTNAIEKINSISDIQERDAVEREYIRLVRQKDKAEQEREDAAINDFYNKAAQDLVNGTTTLTYADTDNIKDPKTRLSLLNYINQMNSKGSVDTSFDIWEELYNKSNNDAQGFAALNLKGYIGYLSESDMKFFTRKQKEIKKGDFYTIIKDDDKMINQALKEMKLDGGKTFGFIGSDDKAIAYGEIKNMIRELEARKGRSATDKEKAEIISSLGYKAPNGVTLFHQIEKGMREKAGFVKDVINDFAYYQSKHNGELPSDEEKFKIINQRVNKKAAEKRTQAQQMTDYFTGANYLYRNIDNTVPKQNEQKVLTYFADSVVPQISNDLGIKLTVTSRFRQPNGKYKSHHSEGRALDISTSEHNTDNRIKIYEKLLSHPAVYKLGTSDPVILAHFNGNTKLKDETEFDKKYGTNHKNHIHVTLINHTPAAAARKEKNTDGKYTF